MLKRAIDDYGDQGRGDVGDLLARFQKIDGAKAETLRRELHKASGEMLPYRLAPLGEGFREPTDEEKIAAAPKTPFGSAQGADRWAAGSMAEVLLGKGDYGDAVTHFRGEIGRDRGAAMPYLAAVHEIMGEKNPAQAAKFATQMQKAGLAAEAEKKPEDVPQPAPTPAPVPPPQPVPPAPPTTRPPESKPTSVPPETTPPVQGKPKPGKGGPIITQPIPPVAKPGPIPPPKSGETDIVQPPGAPGGPMKPSPDLHPSVTIEFDGKEFKAIENGKVVKNWSAVSGRPGYQGAEHQGEKDKGPLPEGEWILRQDQLQTIDKVSEWERLKGAVGRGTWRGLEDSWGKTRVWLEPGQGTDTKGRGGFSVHGGKTPGSAGCIDLTDQMEDFADYFRRMGKDVKVRVDYKRK